MIWNSRRETAGLIRTERAKIREICCRCIRSILYRLHGSEFYVLLLGTDNLFCHPLCVSGDGFYARPGEQWVAVIVGMPVATPTVAVSFFLPGAYNRIDKAGKSKFPIFGMAPIISRRDMSLQQNSGNSCH